ncbi:rab proteins geranylgeranyltransferase component A 2-like [Uloborus diversus]|uniref:rab proteins geranylgeranyltransferase component A 2-like n=1 Tax=Uloborus diversus TaxID=327109 RepID=UPI002408FC50|nr:rab proteins geranylgeranyltransferase component A 2-like [Uloborus diversus]
MEELPNYFDVIVVGTGMPECIIAAAAARIGKKVLHLDRNGYYGGEWASFSFDKFLEWIEEIKDNTENNETQRDTESLNSHLNEGEHLVLCPLKSKSISNANVKSYICDSSEPAVLQQTETLDSQNNTGISIQVDSADNEVSASGDSQSEPISSNNPSVTSTPSSSEEMDLSPSENNNESDLPSNNVALENNATSQDQSIAVQQEWTLSNFLENRRKFNIDLAPKIMFSRGSLVDLLISSNIARYAEFQCVNKVLTYINGHIEQVPCSRADVFSKKTVSVVEKRMLMKFLTFCLKFEEQIDEYQGFEDLLFSDFLKSKKLTSNVEHYIMHAIAMVNEKSNTLQGLKATQKFLQSLGRYGKSPFLCTCYGSAELPQCFCRLCAVYEGMYYLKRAVDGIIMNERCTGIISMNQRINCQWLIMESSYAPPEFVCEAVPQNLSRAILITDASLSPSERKENILLRFPTGPGIVNPITIFEFSSKTYVCPEDLFLVYMICRSSSESAEEDLSAAVNLLFNIDSTTESKAERPNLLWSMYYNQKDTSTVNLNSRVPEGLFLTSSPDFELDYEHAVAEAREIFEKICPGEEFLPRAPDPEDILIETQNNPGEDGEASKIENDVNNSDSTFSEDSKDSSEVENKPSSESEQISSEGTPSKNISDETGNENVSRVD